jgi:hypothetical protein
VIFIVMRGLTVPASVVPRTVSHGDKALSKVANPRPGVVFTLDLSAFGDDNTAAFSAILQLFER